MKDFNGCTVKLLKFIFPQKVVEKEIWLKGDYIYSVSVFMHSVFPSVYTEFTDNGLLNQQIILRIGLLCISMFLSKINVCFII